MGIMDEPCVAHLIGPNELTNQIVQPIKIGNHRFLMQVKLDDLNDETAYDYLAYKVTCDPE
jgi:hypothetical protein